MDDPQELWQLEPTEVLEGGNIDCGGGLVLLLRDAMARVPEGQILEIRSSEGTVCDDLPAWCRMVKHHYLGRIDGAEERRFFVRRGVKAADGDVALEQDKAQAREYQWRTRVRRTGDLRATVYCRNFQFDVGQSASFEERDEHPSAVEVVLGALGSSLAVGFGTECAVAELDIDDIELTVRGKLHNVLAHLGLEDGDPSFSTIEVKCFASTFADEAAVRQAWTLAVGRSPLVATLNKAVELTLKMAIV